MNKRRIAALLAACLLTMAMLGGCGDDGTGKGFRFPLDAEPAGLDPQMATDAPSITLTSVLFEGLTRLDESGAVVPGAADWTVSEDGLTYTFTLFPSYWSTLSIRGQETPWDEPVPVTADDFVFGMQRVVDPATGSALAEQLYGIQNAREIHAGEKPVETLGIRAISDTQLTITLTAADADFLALLATTPFMPCNRAFFAYTAGRYGLEREYLLTNGPFRLAAWNHDESLLLYKHEDYHDAAGIAPEAVRFVIAPEDPASALQTGELDAAPLLPAEAAAAGSGVTKMVLRDTVRSLWFNTTADPLTVLAIRQALRDGIEWQTVNDYLLSLQDAPEQPAVGYIPPAATVSGGELYRRAENARTYQTDAAAARAALTRGLQTLYPEGGATPAALKLSVLAADDTASADLARYIIQSWQKNLKVYASLTLVSEAELASRVKSGRYQIAIYAHTPTGLTGAENLSSYATGASGNLSRLADSAVDTAVRSALQGGRAELDALEQLLWERCPSLPLSYPERYYGFAEDTTGILVRPFGGGAYGSPLDFRDARKWD